ncbi:hypothetical protein I4U23_000633 [Adineta vaga]|nr:hypothetical protein I4U23_000633 [Adineta vaga]
MTLFELESMKNNVSGLIASFCLSTTLNHKIAQGFVGPRLDDDPCLVSMIFKIHLDTGQPIVLINF